MSLCTKKRVTTKKKGSLESFLPLILFDLTRMIAKTYGRTVEFPKTSFSIHPNVLNGSLGSLWNFRIANDEAADENRNDCFQFRYFPFFKTASFYFLKEFFFLVPSLRFCHSFTPVRCLAWKDTQRIFFLYPIWSRSFFWTCVPFVLKMSYFCNVAESTTIAFYYYNRNNIPKI